MLSIQWPNSALWYMLICISNNLLQQDKNLLNA
ncbi:hypothetical protein T4D_3096 [Trichinella pseudospiralis]|uniref:Uncharacterized protein n=1 Tax=Trichinella pseudospiralis TaxID=6337 RepID=A0A0V1C696_TRIPS|nr:hypothetical protein T4D_3096 [Trichinella pseudospiralis]